ncbi:8511_t:CDS:2 [Dentiscutata erythropus]|uniref:8511_t:CDS:1 n=1 Tax=Dentiscutata erythropus TaxID=1348616 RepID=A0A9N8Z348_9GLOM|nr:8511_t:CDS:2 [Dentiscutata erythropus]
MLFSQLLTSEESLHLLRKAEEEAERQEIRRQKKRRKRTYKNGTTMY